MNGYCSDVMSHKHKIWRGPLLLGKRGDKQWEAELIVKNQIRSLIFFLAWSITTPPMEKYIKYKRFLLRRVPW